MDQRPGQRAGEHGKKIEHWKRSPGGVDSDGNVVTKPPELERAEWILGLCRQLHVLPSQILDEPVELLQLMKIELLGNPEGVGHDG